jgi:thimet oligopeptidase
MSNVVYESAVIEGEIEAVWAQVRPLDFRWLKQVHSCVWGAPQDKAGVVGATRILTWHPVAKHPVAKQDQTDDKFEDDKFEDDKFEGYHLTVRVTEVSDVDHCISYDIVSSDVPTPFLSASHTIRLRRVSTPISAQQTFVQAETVFSRDADPNYMRRSHATKQNFFKFLQSDIKHLVTASMEERLKTAKSLYECGKIIKDGGGCHGSLPRFDLSIEVMRALKDAIIRCQRSVLDRVVIRLSISLSSFDDDGKSSSETETVTLSWNDLVQSHHKTEENRFDRMLQKFLPPGTNMEGPSLITNVIAELKTGNHLSWDNVCGRLATMESEAGVLESMVVFPKNVATDKMVRDCATDCATELSEFAVECGMRSDVYQVVKAYSQTNEAKLLTGEKKRYLERLLRDFVRNGLALPVEQQKRIKEISTRMSTLGIQFGRNLAEDKTQFEFTSAQLAGVPSDVLAQFQKKTTNDNGDTYVVTLKYPHYFPTMNLCSVPVTRQTLERAFHSICKETNGPILDELVTLRAELANLLGFKSWAEYITVVRMAKTPQAVNKFLADLATQFKPLLKKEVDVLTNLKRDELKDPLAKLEMADLRYYTRMREEKEFAVDHQQIKQYFPVPVVTAGLLRIYQDLLGLTFIAVPYDSRWGWHKNVQRYDVADTKTQEPMGSFFLDLFPRPGKFTHAACFPLQPGCDTKDGRQLPVAACVCNFAAPLAGSLEPALMLHSEVETFFHEFGHVMHHICSRTELARFSGTSVERDFVEAPSQMLENWCYEPAAIALMSHHVKDASKPSADLLKRIDDATNASAGLFNSRQIALATFDQTIHSISASDLKTPPLDTAQVFAEEWQRLMGTDVPVTKDTHFAATFGHLAQGYPAQYYGYLWAESLSADMFTTRFDQDVLDQKAGRDYRRCILEPGGSRDAILSVTEFLGRPPNPTAFLISKGLATKDLATKGLATTK